MIHVILALPSTLFCNAVRKELEEQADIRVVAQVARPVELLYSTAIQQADVVIIEPSDDNDVPGILSHLFAEFPQIMAIVLGRHQDRVIVYRQQLCKRVYQRCSIAELLAELRSADTEYWQARANGRGSS